MEIADVTLTYCYLICMLFYDMVQKEEQKKILKITKIYFKRI